MYYSGTVAATTVALVISIKVEHDNKLRPGTLCCSQWGDVPQVPLVLQEQSQPVELFLYNTDKIKFTEYAYANFKYWKINPLFISRSHNASNTIQYINNMGFQNFVVSKV